MTVEAKITSIWKKQKGFLALFFVGIGLWFLFDGKVGFPKSNDRWLAHEKFKTENRLSEWPQFAKNAGWNETPPHKYYKKNDIAAQYFIGALAVVFGMAVFIYWAGQIKLVFKLEEGAVIIPGGKRVPFESITGINRKKWDDKGLATIYYSIDGRAGKFILDDYKFDPQPMREIMKEIEGKAKL